MCSTNFKGYQISFECIFNLNVTIWNFELKLKNKYRIFCSFKVNLVDATTKNTTVSLTGQDKKTCLSLKICKAQLRIILIAQAFYVIEFFTDQWGLNQQINLLTLGRNHGTNSQLIGTSKWKFLCLISNRGKRLRSLCKFIWHYKILLKSLHTNKAVFIDLLY